ncbi:hypothetical protein [Rhodoferax sp. GW822-FHT02A01]|uniref:hypothetical protein n=1 Tax=Rhodoferax sp. GW822-FHT02A01 TaxID=3141537 RepID=UPI00315C62BD
MYKNIILFLAVCASIQVSAAEQMLKGTYKVPSPYCTSSGVPDPKTNEWPSCLDTYDCFSIKNVKGNRYWFSVEAVQANYHYCTATGYADRVDGQYVYIGDGTKATPDLTFSAKDGLIKFQGSRDLCGARADWSAVSIPISTLKSQSAVNCIKH